MVDEEMATDGIKGKQIANLTKSQINNGAFAVVLTAYFHELKMLTGGQEATAVTTSITPIVPTVVGTPGA